MYANGECDVCAKRQDDKTTGAMYANDSAMYASNRNHDEDSEVDGDKRQPLLTTRQRRLASSRHMYQYMKEQETTSNKGVNCRSYCESIPRSFILGALGIYVPLVEAEQNIKSIQECGRWTVSLPIDRCVNGEFVSRFATPA